MRIHYSVKHWFNIACILVLLPFSNLALSNYTKLDPAAALSLIDENGHADIPDTYTSIDDDAFRDTDLKSVTIPDSVTSIEEGAFNNTKLTSVIIPASVTSIGESAFSGGDCDEYWDDINEDYYEECRKLDQVVFADGSQLETIGAYSFYNNNLTSLDLPDSVISIGGSAFADNTNLVAVDFGESLVGIDYFAFAGCLSLKTITLPNTLEGIGYAAFFYTSLTSLVIPDSVSFIDPDAFGFRWDSESNKQLESVVIGDSLEYIPESLFENQRNLHTVVIGDSVTTIGGSAFRGAPISSLIMGANVTSIGENAFNAVNGDVFILKPAQENFDIYDFSSMANVYACDSLDDIGTEEGCDFAYDGTNYTKLDPPAALSLIDENGHADIPNTYTNIGADAFRDTDLKSVTIPDLVTSIEEGAFNNTKLTSVIIPASVTNIAQWAFRGGYCDEYWDDINEDYYEDCGKLDQVVFADGSQLETIGNLSFSNNNLTSLDLPDSVISIGGSAFAGNTNLVSVDFGESLVSIDYYAFADCLSLTTITLPNTLERIDSGAFSRTSLTSLVIPDSVSFIDRGAFGFHSDSESNKQLESVVIGDSLEYIHGSLFENQRNLHTVVIGDSVTTIGGSAFRGAPISSLIMGANVTSIGENAFNAVNGDVFILKPAQENFDIYDFSSMANVYACDSLDDIGTEEGCDFAYDGTNYTKLDPPAALALIDENGHADIPNTYTNIGADAFRDTDLKSVAIPDSVISIEEYAFNNTKLTSVIIPASVTSIGESAFSGGDCDEYWDDINEDYYEDCRKLDQVVFADGSQLETIGTYSFSNNNLTSLDLPDSVISIGGSAFADNTNLVSVDFGESLVSIESDAFGYTDESESNKQLESVVIGDSLQYIPNQLFENQKNLHTVVIGDSVTTIGGSAFRGAPISSLIIGC
jgi:hypothetical protein